MADLLFISPNERGAPRTLAPVSQAVKPSVPTRHSVTDLHHHAATRTAIDHYLRYADCTLYLGHGRPNSLGASTSNPLIDNNNLTGNQILVALACHAGAMLAPSVFTTAATGVFVGFTTVMIHPRRQYGRANTAYENALATFLTGGTAIGLHTDLITEMNMAAMDYLAQPRTSNTLFAFAALRANTVALTIVGDGSRTI
ncbi:hypothetical protein GFY24_03755 [Nocardia sp. SYP-A9097]|uniref:hypothetical protein n=1 Tax=Nocardia sp. SYP-A9097 TaxID=2663237 RepID=UPI00129B5ACA|nr:hypothetical protein [Nocardia sp. SYP-A9097]MRH86594.1 hypothetical protein [Nocardia sp. SYP-A9097]